MKYQKSKRGRKPKIPPSPYQMVKCQQKEQAPNNYVKDARWTFKEDILLVKNYNQYPKDWQTISEVMVTRSPSQCSIRYNWLVKNNKIKLIEKTLKKKIGNSKDSPSIEENRESEKISEVGKNIENSENIGNIGNISEEQIDYNIEKVEIVQRVKTQQEIHKFWNHEEDIRLLKLYEQFKQCQNRWEVIASKLVQRTQKKCKQRYTKLIRENPSLVHSIDQFINKKVRPRSKTWTDEEDETLLKLVEIHGNDWGSIAEQMGTRGRNQAKNRYNNYLSNFIQISEWTKQEDQIILEMVKKVGRKYKIISTKLPGRSPAQVRNRLANYLQKYYEIKISYINNERYANRLKRTRRLYKKKKYRQKLKMKKLSQQISQQPIKKEENIEGPIFYQVEQKMATDFVKEEYHVKME